ncbi:hypothetical protein QJS04_geneDACA001601 [Acorus gramineus]|uniref:CUE domain-containing protein n=1 Tax=Acorus gramineus TaxID=55184 RepID=A0AAV9BKC5_ACOGR|nr:hypothetical protein QJS04_geneDACA001601 [Acorus gramineus]
MSSRPATNGRGSFRGQRFVPKSDNPRKPSAASSSSSAGGRQSLTASLRNESAAAGTRPKASAGGGGQGSNFVNYLPQDEAIASGLGVEAGGLDAVESQKVVDLLNEELSRLLRSKPKDFWREVASNDSLHGFLDSFLQFRHRWYDFPHHGAKDMVAGVIVGDHELSRRVFMVYYRISSNKDPGARASESLSAKDHEALLQEKKLLELPKLLDICAIYGHDNEALTRSLVTNAIKAQPWLLENLFKIVSHFLGIAHTMHQRCSSSLEVLISSGSHEDKGGSRLHADFLEVMDFINDAVVTLDAFVNAYKHAAVCLLFPLETSCGNEDLLCALARLHDSFLPTLKQGLISVIHSSGSQNSVATVDLSFKLLLLRIVSFGWKLLDICYLNEIAMDGSFHLQSAKMFPSTVEDPVIRGDILVQIFKDINGEISYHSQENQRNGTFLQNIEKNCRILSRIQDLRSNGWLFLDNEQFQYLSLIATPPSISQEKYQKLPVALSTDKAQKDEDTAILESKISQIKDLFPDYGKGFLSACLEIYNQDPEEVIQRILEGTLHRDLQSLDTSLEHIQQPKPSSINRIDKGKGALIEPSTSTSNADDRVAARVTRAHSSSSSTTSSVGRFSRKPTEHLPANDILNSQNDKESSKTVMLASQYEYEDEYDDSFDELGLSVVESAEETESFGDRMRSSSGDNGSNSRWTSQKKPQFYVKDGKNYSYKVSGSVAVSNVNEAALVNQAQKEVIHGLGRGGNLPLGAVKALMEKNSDTTADVGAAGGAAGGRRGSSSRGRGGSRGGGNHHQRDRAMKKHFSGLTGF